LVWNWKLVVGVGLVISALSSLMPWLTIQWGLGSQSLNLIDFLGGLVVLQPILSGLHLDVNYATGVIALMLLSPILLGIAIVLGIVSLAVRKTASVLLPVSGTSCTLASLLGILAIQILKQSVLIYGEQTAYAASLIQIGYGIYAAVLGSVIVWIGYFNSRLTLSGRAIAGAVGLVVLVLFSSLLVTQFPLGIFPHQQQLILESYRFPIGGPLYATFRNRGSTTLDMEYADYFVNGMSINPTVWMRGTGCTILLPQDTSCSETYDVSYALRQLAPGVSYPLKVWLYGPSGTPETGPAGEVLSFSYSVTYGSS
jgi:hypothetical protein